jgi:hypothetical protein
MDRTRPHQGTRTRGIAPSMRRKPSSPVIALTAGAGSWRVIAMATFRSQETDLRILAAGPWWGSAEATLHRQPSGLARRGSGPACGDARARSYGVVRAGGDPTLGSQSAVAVGLARRAEQVRGAQRRDARGARKGGLDRPWWLAGARGAAKGGALRRSQSQLPTLTEQWGGLLRIPARGEERGTARLSAIACSEAKPNG